MTEYQAEKYKKRKELYIKMKRAERQKIKERDNLIYMTMKFVFEYEDPSAALRYVKWKVRQIHEERCLHEQASC